MAIISWVNFVNGDTLATIRNKLNAFNTSAETEIAANASAITANTALISTNTTNIATNTADIVTATSVLSALDTRLDTLDSKVLFVPRFAYQQVTGFTVTTDTYSPITTLTTDTWEAGTYRLDLSMVYSLNSSNNSAYFRFRVNGSAWTEVRRETKDVTDLVPVSYTSLTVIASESPIIVDIEGYKESLADTLSIPELTVMVERKA